MRATKTLIALTGALLGALGVGGCRGQESSEPPIHLVLNMDTQEKGKAYREDTSGIFADGRIMRAPVPGTVAVGQLDADARLVEGVDEEGQPTLTFPAGVKQGNAIPAATIARGKARYAIYCSPCHGVGLDGKGVMSEPGLDSNPRMLVPPPSFHSKRLRNMPIGQMYSAIKNGVNEGNMGSYAAQIPLADRWAILAYVRTSQMAKDPKVELEGGKIMKLMAVDVASADYGSQVYEAKGCVACHSTDGTKVVGPSFQGLFGRTEQTSEGEVVADAAYLHESIRMPAAKIVMGYPPAMPTLQLTDLEVDSLVLFIESLK